MYVQRTYLYEFHPTSYILRIMKSISAYIDIANICVLGVSYGIHMYNFGFVNETVLKRNPLSCLGRHGRGGTSHADRDRRGLPAHRLRVELW